VQINVPADEEEDETEEIMYGGAIGSGAIGGEAIEEDAFPEDEIQ